MWENIQVIKGVRQLTDEEMKHLYGNHIVDSLKQKVRKKQDPFQKIVNKFIYMLGGK